MFAETNWPRDSFGFACFAASYALWSASGVVPSFAAIPLNDSLFFGATVDGVDGFALDGCDIGRTWVVVGFPCARTALAAPSVRLAATAIPITAVVIGFMHFLRLGRHPCRRRCSPLAWTPGGHKTSRCETGRGDPVLQGVTSGYTAGLGRSCAVSSAV